jgi:uncharacterized protein DUF2334
MAEIVAAATAISPPLMRRLISKAPLQDLALRWGDASLDSESRALHSGGPASNGGSRFLVRVDDFPAHDRDNSEFLEFHSIMSEQQIPYLLGVTPNLASNPLDPAGKSMRGMTDADIAVLRRVCGDGVDLALHGFTHRMRGPDLRSELSGVPEPELRGMLERALGRFAEWGLPEPIAFIPPFNAVDLAGIRVISDYLSILCGGPESIHSLGFRACPETFEGMEFWPSFFPAYGRARSVSAYVRSTARWRSRYLIPITLHWRWEKADEFRGVRDLAALLSGNAERWENRLTSSVARRRAAHGRARYSEQN